MCLPGCLSAHLACLLVDITDKSSSSSSRVVQDIWDVYRDVLGLFLSRLFMP